MFTLIVEDLQQTFLGSTTKLTYALLFLTSKAYIYDSATKVVHMQDPESLLSL